MISLRFSRLNLGFKTGREPSRTPQTELTLRMDKKQLFDAYIVAPHPAVSKEICKRVDRFIQREGLTENMTLSIFTEPLQDATMEKLREAYYEHYDGEYVEISRYLQRRYRRALLLVIVSLAAITAWGLLARSLADSSIPLTLLCNFGTFCFWEVGYTHLDRVEAEKKRDQIRCARDARIEFWEMPAR